jgi:hypothetical protein
MVGGMLLLRMWSKNMKNLFTPNNPKLAEVHALSTVLKSMSTWKEFDGIHECRSACGGLGYSYYSRLSILMANCDVH